MSARDGYDPRTGADVFGASGRSLWPERGVRWSKARHTAFENELDRIKRLAGVNAVTFEKGWLQSSK